MLYMEVFHSIANVHSNEEGELLSGSEVGEVLVAHKNFRLTRAFYETYIHI